MLKKINNLLKENYKFILVVVIIYFLMSYELPYAICTPGGAINMSERITGKNLYDYDGSINMTYVSMVKGSPIFLAIAKINPNWDIVSKSKITYDEDDLKETIAIDKIYMREAISNAEYVAYKYSGIEFKEENVSPTVTYIVNDANTGLKHGDIIIGIDDIEIKNLEDMQTYIATKKSGDIVNIKYKRGGKIKVDKTTLITINDKVKAGISIANIYDYHTDYNIDIKTKSSESGPSGGFMTALAIYNSLTEEDITGGNTIMGTGTIDKEGNIGEIGGVKYKLIGAKNKGADIFICPMENYDEAIKIAKNNKYEIKILGVKTFDEAIEKISNIRK